MSNIVSGMERAGEIIFISEAHKKFYYKKLKEVRYHKALCYCLGISDDVRRNINRIYNFKTGCVKTECLHKNTSKVHNIKAYLLTCLFNAPSTISSYYRAEVNHDLYGIP